MFDIACIGILVADVICKTVDKIPERGKLGFVDSLKLYNGGCAMSAAIDMSILGAKTAILGKVGNDGFGTYLTGVLAQHKVNTEGLAVDNKVDTSASVVLVDSGGERTFLHCKGANDALRYDDIYFDVIDASRIVFVAGSMLMNSFDGEPCARVLKRAKDIGKITALDTAWDDSGRWMKVLGPALRHVDYFIPSIEEARELSGESEPDKIADKFFDAGVSHVVIKLGKDGCYFRESRDLKGKTLATFPGKPVDTTGAGDSFCSGFLYGISAGMTMEDSCLLGNAVGTHCVLSVGATTGIRPYEEMKKFIASF
ncbi:MAG: carbohydrate kinase family protein [Clostridia bacterium]